MMFSLALADLLVGLTLIPQVVHEDWIVKQNVTHNLTGVETYKGTNNETLDDFDGTNNETLDDFDGTTCRYIFDGLLPPHYIVQASLWDDLAQCYHLHLHVHLDLHHEVGEDQRYNIYSTFPGLSCTTTATSSRST